MTIQRTHVTSSAIASIGYDPVARVLEVEFASGNVYRYFDVPSDAHDRFLVADSKGAWFNREIRSRFDYAHDGADPDHTRSNRIHLESG